MVLWTAYGPFSWMTELDPLRWVTKVDEPRGDWNVDAGMDDCIVSSDAFLVRESRGAVVGRL
jgi:hypothetical protein